MYHVVIAVVPKHKHLIKKIFFLLKQKQIAMNTNPKNENFLLGTNTWIIVDKILKKF